MNDRDYWVPLNVPRQCEHNKLPCLALNGGKTRLLGLCRVEAWCETTRLVTDMGQLVYASRVDSVRTFTFIDSCTVPFFISIPSLTDFTCSHFSSSPYTIILTSFSRRKNDGEDILLREFDGYGAASCWHRNHIRGKA